MSKNPFSWFRNEVEKTNILRIDGPINSDIFWGDEVTPGSFRKQLNNISGDLVIEINSPGGDILAAAEIYTMLLEYPGNVTVKIIALAASAASVIAMAGNKIIMSPVGMMMIHDPITLVWGNEGDMDKAKSVLHEFKESIINAYQKKTGLSRKKLADLMTEETWMNAKAALSYGFIDEILDGVSWSADSEPLDDDPDKDEPDKDEPDKDEPDKDEPETDDKPKKQETNNIRKDTGTTMANDGWSFSMNNAKVFSPERVAACFGMRHNKGRVNGLALDTVNSTVTVTQGNVENAIISDNTVLDGAFVVNFVSAQDIADKIVSEIPSLPEEDKKKEFILNEEGRTIDGSVPYSLLMRQLEKMR